MGPVLALQLDELQRAVKLLQVFSEDSQRFLQSLSEQLGERQPLGVGPGASGGLVNGGVNGDFFPPAHSEKDLPAAGEQPRAEADRRPAEGGAAAGGAGRDAGPRAALGAIKAAIGGSFSPRFRVRRPPHLSGRRTCQSAGAGQSPRGVSGAAQ